MNENISIAKASAEENLNKIVVDTSCSRAFGCVTRGTPHFYVIGTM
jgi:hypothetical protein